MASTPDTGRLTFLVGGRVPIRVLLSATTPTNNGRFPLKHHGSPFIGLPPAPGSFDFTAGAGSYALTGADGMTLATRQLNASAGSYAVTAAEAILVWFTPSGNYTMVMNPGDYQLTGFLIETPATRVLTADPGAYILEGAAARLRDSGVSLVGPGFLLRRRRRQQKGES